MFVQSGSISPKRFGLHDESHSQSQLSGGERGDGRGGESAWGLSLEPVPLARQNPWASVAQREGGRRDEGMTF